MVGSLNCFSRNSVRVPMDFNLKSKVYEQFESLCRDIDEFVNQDTVKFVESQVKSVKKIYSNVVQVLPGECVKPKFTCQCDHVSNGDPSQEAESLGEYRDDESFHVSTSVKSYQHENMHIMSSTCTLPESSSIVESADSIKKTENICHSNSDPDESKDVNALPVMVSNDNNVIQTDSSDFVIGSSENASETANVNDMETVELSPEDDGRSVFPNIDCGDHVPTYRIKNFRYYKKLLKDAFSSQKRLAKEYEQLGILYGDIDMEANKHFEPSFVPSLPIIANDATKKIQSSQEMCETEWELL